MKKKELQKPIKRGRGRPPKPKSTAIKLNNVEFVSADDHIFLKFIELYSTGLYDINSASLRLGVDVIRIKELIERDDKSKELWRKAVEKNKEFSKDKLVEKALMALNQQIEGTEKIISKRYRFNGKKKILFEEVESNKGIQFNAVKEVLSNFTDVFSDNLNPEKAAHLLLGFNKFLVEKTGDLNLADTLLPIMEEYINYLFIKNKK